MRVEQSARRGEAGLPHGSARDHDALRPQAPPESGGGGGILGLGRAGAEETSGTEVVGANAVALHVAGDGGEPERLELGGDVVQRRAGAAERP